MSSLNPKLDRLRKDLMDTARKAVAIREMELSRNGMGLRVMVADAAGVLQRESMPRPEDDKLSADYMEIVLQPVPTGHFFSDPEVVATGVEHHAGREWTKPVDAASAVPVVESILDKVAPRAPEPDSGPTTGLKPVPVGTPRTPVAKPDKASPAPVAAKPFGANWSDDIPAIITETPEQRALRAQADAELAAELAERQAARDAVTRASEEEFARYQAELAEERTRSAIIQQSEQIMLASKEVITVKSAGFIL